MNIDIEETEVFKRVIKKEKIDPEDVKDLKSELKENPKKGDVIPNSGGLRKIRMSVDNIGKRSGARVIYLYVSIKNKIYLITAYKKGDKENLTSDELKLFRNIVKILKGTEN